MFKKLPLVLFLLLLFPVVTVADTVGWAGLGLNWTPLPDPFTTTSAGGVTVTGSMPAGPVWITQQCVNITPCLAGDFLPGDPLLWTNYTSGPLTLTFGVPLTSIATQIQTVWYGPFTATLTAYDYGGTVLGTTTLNGDTLGNQSGQAPFLTFTDPTGSITSVAITAVSAYPRSGYDGLFINQLTIQAAPAPVPEPGTLVLLGTGLLATGLLRRRAG